MTPRRSHRLIAGDPGDEDNAPMMTSNASGKACRSLKFLLFLILVHG
jgi:hypothetical protein